MAKVDAVQHAIQEVHSEKLAEPTNHDSTFKDSRTKTFGREIILALIGVVAGLIASMIMASVQSGNQIRQMILEKRIDFIRKVSEDYDKLSLEVIPSGQRLHDHIYRMESGEIPISYKNNQVIDSELAVLCSKLNGFSRSLSTNAAIGTALFGLEHKISPSEPCVFKAEDMKAAITLESQNGQSVSDKEYLKGLRQKVEGLLTEWAKQEIALRRIVNDYADRLNQ